MGFINNPVPRSLGKESKKAASILASFIKPNQVLGQEVVIPPEVLANAQGLAILTVLKAGFLFSGRAGSGVIVARLSDGGWSAPSAIATAGAGVGGQVGAELTDFVFILNNRAAVESFASSGTLTLGGNVSLAAGPIGRNAEAAGSANTRSVAAIFAYSKTKGLFAGVSLEGSLLVARKDANRRFYGRDVTPKQILSGRVEPPPGCDPLFRVLESRIFSRGARAFDDDYYYDDIPDFSDSDESSYYGGRRGSRNGNGGGARRGNYDYEDEYDREYESAARNRSRRRNSAFDDGDAGWDDDDDAYAGRGSRARSNSHREFYSSKTVGNGTSSSSGGGRDRASSWRDDVYDDYPRRTGRYNGGSSASNDRDRDRGKRYDDGLDDDISELDRRMRRSTFSDPAPKRYGSRDKMRDHDRDRDYDRDYGYSGNGAASTNASSIRDKPTGGSSQMTAVALYTFSGEQEGDLSFKKGDVINITKRSDSKDDWWSGTIGGQEGIFPANYVDVI